MCWDVNWEKKLKEEEERKRAKERAERLIRQVADKPKPVPSPPEPARA